MGVDSIHPGVRQRRPDSDNERSNSGSDTEYDTLTTTLDATVMNKIMSSDIPATDKMGKLKELGSHTPILPSEIGTDFNYKRQVVWFNAIGFLILHICCVIGVLLAVFCIPDYRTTLYAFFLIFASGIGVTMGAHRLWSHRSFKATPALRLVLLWLHTLAGQNCLYVWVRDHRQHHKFSDTDADPHNANRGFFFSHVGWLMSKKHPKVIEYGKKIDMSDLEADRWIMFQKKHYKVLYTFFALLIPTAVPIVCWYENPLVALFVAFFARSVLLLNGTWLVNSAAHLYGTRPFDKTIFPVESMFVSFLAVGEGWHNYHHAFPWDYKASELGSPLNPTTHLINFLAKFGWVYDRKEATDSMVKNRILRTGDHSHKVHGTVEGQNAIKTWKNTIKHPLNPSYNSIYSPKPKIINANGYALTKEDMCQEDKNDDGIMINTSDITNEFRKYIVDKTIVNDIGKDSTPLDIMNNNLGKEFGNKQIKQPKDKYELNVNADDILIMKV